MRDNGPSAVYMLAARRLRDADAGSTDVDTLSLGALNKEAKCQA
jgi:hypothetical protein